MAKISKAKIKSIVYTAMSLLLSVIFIMSAITGTTLAWEDFSQHKTNEFEGNPAPVSVLLNKYEKDEDGNIVTVPADDGGNMVTIRVKDAEFYLFMVIEDGEDIQIGGRYTTDQNGQIKVYALKTGDYYFVETNPSYGYDYDIIDGRPVEAYYFSVVQTGDPETIEVEAYNRRLTSGLSIRKSVENSDGSSLTEEQQDEEFEFIVTFSDDGTYDYSIDGQGGYSISSGGSIFLKHEQKAVIEELPAGVYYTITEVPKDGYTLTRSHNHSGNILPEGVTAEFINTYYRSVGVLKIHKEVSGDGADPDKLFRFTVVFSDDGTYDYTIDGINYFSLDSGATIELKHGETAVFPDLPAGITYTVTEDDYSTDGYIAVNREYHGSMIESNEIYLNFHNYKISDEDVEGSLTIEKEVDGEDADLEKEFTFTVHFSDDGTYDYRIDGGSLQSLSSGETITLKHGQTAVFEDIPTGVGYRVEEDDYTQDGYQATITIAEGTIAHGDLACITFVNIKKEVEEVPDEVEIIVKKIIDNEFPDSDSEKEFWFTMIIDDVEHRFSLKHGEEKSFTVPYGTSYMVYEDDYYNEQYIQTSLVNGGGIADREMIEVVQTNTYTGQIMIAIEGSKTWDFGGYTDVDIPAGIVVTLKSGSTVVAVQVVTAADNWQWQFVVPKYEADGTTRIDYQIEEDTVPGFITKINGYDITNIYTPSKVSLDPPVEKIVAGNPDNPAVFRFELKALTDGAPMPAGSSGNTKTVSVNGSGAVEFGDIEFYKEGTYIYTIAEIDDSLAGYEYDPATYEIKVVTKFLENDPQLLNMTVTYTKISDAGRNALSGVDKDRPLQFINRYEEANSEQTGYTPGITKFLTGDIPAEADETFVFTITAGDNSYPMPENDKVSIKGTGDADFGRIVFTQEGVYTYTMREQAGSASGYTYDDNIYTLTVTVTRDENGNLAAQGQYTSQNNSVNYSRAVFTNNYTYTLAPTGETIIIEGAKIWNHGDNAAVNHPQSIIIHIRRNGKTFISREISEDNHWRWSYELDKYDAAGNEIEYSIDESDVANYVKTIDGFNIINTHTSAAGGSSGSGGGSQGSGSGTGSGKDNPKTGDDRTFIWWYGLMIVSGAGAVICVKKRKNMKGKE